MSFVEVFSFIFLKMRPQTTTKKLLLKNITKTCVRGFSFTVLWVYVCGLKLSGECHSCDCAEFPVWFILFFWSMNQIYRRIVIVIESSRVIIRKVIRCALTLQQSQFSTTCDKSGPTLTTNTKYTKNVDCKKEMLRQRHWEKFECEAHHVTQALQHEN